VGKKSYILKHVADMPPQADGIPLARVAPLDEHRACRGDEQPVDELEERALSGAAPPDDRDHLSGVHRQAYAGQGRRPSRILKRRVVETHQHDIVRRKGKSARRLGANHPALRRRDP
jgi:hypothetical protein